MTIPLRRDAAANRVRILAAAIDVFGARGAEAGIDDIARRAGVGVGTVYRRFPTKEALVQAIVAQLLRDLVEVAKEALEAPAEEGLSAFLYGAGELQAQHAGCLWQLWASGPECDQIRAELRETLQRVLTRAHRSGAIRDGITYEDVWMIVWSIAGIIESVREVDPDLWRRSLELTLIGLRPSADELRQPSLAAGGLDEVSFQAGQRRNR